MKTKPTTFNLGGIKLIFGTNSCEKLQAELTKRKLKKVLVVTDPGIRASGLLDIFESVLETPYVIFSDVPADPPAETIVSALSVLENEGCDGVIAIGGGSPMDVAKGVRLLATNDGTIFEYDNSPTGGREFENQGLFLACIPTTAGTGSEVTPYAIITNKKEKRKATIGGTYVSPNVAIVDPSLTLNLPPAITASTGMDALAHAIGAYTSGRVIDSQGDTAISDTLSYKAIELIASNLRQAYSCGTILQARSNMLMGSVLGAFSSNAGSDATHGLGHALGAVYHVPHGVACAMVMPYVMEYNLAASPERFARIAVAFGEDTTGLSPMEAAYKSVVAVKRLMVDIHIPKLSEYITNFDDFDELCKVAAEEKCSKLNSRVITLDVAKELLMKAYDDK